MAQLRFRLSKPCSAITLKLTAYKTNFYGNVYWKYSTAEKDETLARASSIAGAAYDAKSFTENAYEVTTVTVNGTFPAGQDLYLYGFNCPADGGTWSAVHMYALYSGTYCTKVTGGTEIIGTASTIALTGGVLGGPVKIQITRDNADFVHTLNWSFAGHSGTIAAKTGDTIVSWTPDADTFGAYIPTASSGTLTVSCTTYYGAEQIGTAQTASLTLSVPSDAAPTLSDGWASVSYSNGGTAAEGIAACIAGYSKAVVTFDESKVTAKYGATIKTVTAKLGGSSVTGSGTIGTVSGTGNTVTLTATDSRGKKTSQNVTLSAYAYSMPVLGGVTVFRCSSAGAEDDGGAYYSAKATVTYSTAGGKISCALTAAIKAVGGSYGTAAALTPGTASVLGGGLSATVSYVVRIRAVDSLGNAAVVEVMIPTAAVAFHIPDGGNGLGFGKYNEADGYVDSAWPVKMNGNRIAGLGTPTDDSDAVTRGYADSAYAPSGYGLGTTTAKLISDCNAWTQNGFFGLSGASLVNGPGSNIGYGAMLQLNRQGGNRVFQIAVYQNLVAQRYYENGEWSEWEYANPPMKVGVEYRTTERWNGKAVYTKLVNCGTMPNAANVNINCLTPSMTVVDFSVMFIKSGMNLKLPHFDTSGNLLARAICNTGSSVIQIYTTTDYSGYTGYALLKYTKD